MNDSNSRSLCDGYKSHNDLQHLQSLYGPDYIPYEWITGGECVVCKTPFEGMHLASQKTCGPTCRKRLQRMHEREERAMSLAMSELQTMRAGIKRKERLPEFISELNRLKAEINDLLLLAGDPDAMAKNQMLVDRKRVQR